MCNDDISQISLKVNENSQTYIFYNLKKYSGILSAFNYRSWLCNLTTISLTDDFLSPKQVEEKAFVKRPKRPDRSREPPSRPKTAVSASVPRPLSSTSPRPSSSASCDRPPFVLYGSGDTELQTGSKRTHNVHCSTDVSLMSNIASLFFFCLGLLRF